jgi:hypothetical protein
MDGWGVSYRAPGFQLINSVIGFDSSLSTTACSADDPSAGFR